MYVYNFWCPKPARYHRYCFLSLLQVIIMIKVVFTLIFLTFSNASIPIDFTCWCKIPQQICKKIIIHVCSDNFWNNWKWAVHKSLNQHLPWDHCPGVFQDHCLCKIGEIFILLRNFLGQRKRENRFNDTIRCFGLKRKKKK